MRCSPVPGFLPGFALPRLAFLHFLRADDEDEDGGEAGSRTPGHYKLET